MAVENPEGHMAVQAQMAMQAQMALQR